MEIKIGTRGSRLALIQADYVKKGIEKVNSNIKATVVTIKTTADKVQDRPLYRIGGKGLFLKEIEQCLAEGDIDMAVHSMKDVPCEISGSFEIAAITKREDPRDALITREPLTLLSQLKKGAKIGTGSFRRGSQLLHVKSDIEILPIRGNQDTRLKKMRTNNMDGIVLAMAGILRMEFEDIHVLPLDAHICLPAGGQGSIGIEIRRNDAEVRDLVQPLDDPIASVCIQAERACLRGLGAECYTPVAAFAEIVDSRIHLRAMVADLLGQRLLKDEIMGDLNNPESLGEQLADQLLSMGGEGIMRELKKSL